MCIRTKAALSIQISCFAARQRYITLKNRKECGLFHLFIKKCFMGTALRSWTNNQLIADGKRRLQKGNIWRILGWKWQFPLHNSSQLMNNGKGICFKVIQTSSVSCLGMTFKIYDLIYLHLFKFNGLYSVLLKFKVLFKVCSSLKQLFKVT
jgi:hypothetical protein